jgi:hypothetical protein
MIYRSIIPLSSTVKISLIGRHHSRDHLLGSYSGRIIDFLLDKGMFCPESSSLDCVSHCRLDKPLTLQDDR